MKHEPTECHCGEPYCPLCDGGLFICQVCSAAECELTTECPGRRMTGPELNDVCKGKLDFKDGEWRLIEIHAPTF